MKLGLTYTLWGYISIVFYIIMNLLFCLFYVIMHLQEINLV